MTRLRLLLLYWGRFGGGARYALDLARALGAHAEVEVHLSFSPQAELAPAMRALGLPSLEIATFDGKLSALAASTRLIQVRAALARYVERHRIDAVLCAMTHAWTPFVASALRATGAKVFVAAHDGALHEGERSFLRQRLIWWELARADGVIALSEWVRGQLLARPGLSPERVRVAPLGGLGVRPSPAPRRHPGTAPFRLLFFGRILPYKNLGALLEAFRRLRAESPALRLHVAGPGSLAPYAEALRGLDGLTIANRWIDEPDVEAVVGAADALVAPYREASQSAAVAMASHIGIPSVVTPVGALPEQVQDGATGVVAGAVDPESLALALRRLVRDADLYHRCAAELHRRAALAAIGFAEAYVAVLSELVGQKRSPRERRTGSRAST